MSSQRNEHNKYGHRESALKDLPPALARLLYAARVDPNLCVGADVVPDVDDKVKLLEKVQVSYLQRTLGLSSYCMGSCVSHHIWLDAALIEAVQIIPQGLPTQLPTLKNSDFNI